VSGGGKTWTLVNATPDVHLQIESYPALHPGPGRRETPLRNILLTDAELDHTIGLLLLREGMPLDVYGTGAVLATLAGAFPVRRLLEFYAPIRWHEIRPQDGFLLEDGRLRVKALPLGRKRPRFATDPKIDGDWVVGYRFEDAETKGVAIYAPAVEAWSPELAAELGQADCVFVDGTFWKEDEMIKAGTGQLAAAAMGHLPISGPDGSARHLSALGVKRRVYVHINNTNPVLDERSAENRFLAERGIEAGWDGMSMEV
jgi:pyrroloquinoline quinone biosynthesis protein B